MIPISPINLQLGDDALWTIINNASLLLGGKPLSEKQFELGRYPYQGLARLFHGLEHAKGMAFMRPVEIEDLAREINDRNGITHRIIAPIVTLGGFYHDVVYTQVDNGVTDDIREILEKYVIQNTDQSYTLRDDITNATDKKILELTAAIFGVEPGETLPLPIARPIQNEFLSALVAAHEMNNLGIKSETIALVIAVIESTIPFRDAKRLYALKDRLETANQNFGLVLSDEEIERAMYAATFESNKDVIGFAGNLEESPLDRFRAFMQGTWRLLPEMNPAFRGTVYTPQDYRRAMQGNHFFLTQLLGSAPGMQVFHAYEEYPSAHTMKMMERYEGEARTTASIYLICKTVSVALVEAVAAVAGIDPTITLPDLARHSDEFLPESNPGKLSNQTAQIAWEVLQDGRGDSPCFDISRAPLAAYLLANLGDKKMIEIFGLIGTHLKPGQENYSGFISVVKNIMGQETLLTLAHALASASEKQNQTGRATLINAFATRVQTGTLPTAPASAPELTVA